MQTRSSFPSRELYKAIDTWTIDAGRPAPDSTLTTQNGASASKPDLYFIAEDRIDRFFGRKPAFIVGKKGTGKTDFARHLTLRHEYTISKVEFDEVLGVYRDILGHQKDSSDPATIYLSLQIAAVIVGLRHIKNPRSLKRAIRTGESSRRLLTRDRTFPKIVNSLTKIGVKQNGDSGAGVEVSATSTFSVKHSSEAIRKELAKIQAAAAGATEPIFFIVDAIDDHEGFRTYPFSAEASALLRATLTAFRNWAREATTISLTLIIRPEFIEAAEIPNARQRILDAAWHLRWDPDSLTAMLNFRINQEFTAASKRRTGMPTTADASARSILGATGEDYQKCMSRVMEYSFFRPRDLIQHLKYASEWMLDHGDADCAIAPDNLSFVLDRQRAYLFDEVAAEIAISVPHSKVILSFLIDLAAKYGAFIARSDFDFLLHQCLYSRRLDVDHRSISQKLYSSFAIGYRGAANSRQFGYFPDSRDILPDDNEITLHPVFQETPSDHMRRFVDPLAPIG